MRGCVWAGVTEGMVGEEWGVVGGVNELGGIESLVAVGGGLSRFRRGVVGREGSPAAVEKFLSLLRREVRNELLPLLRSELRDLFVGEAASMEGLSLRWRDFGEGSAGHGAQSGCRSWPGCAKKLSLQRVPATYGP